MSREILRCQALLAVFETSPYTDVGYKLSLLRGGNVELYGVSMLGFRRNILLLSRGSIRGSNKADDKANNVSRENIFGIRDLMYLRINNGRIKFE